MFEIEKNVQVNGAMFGSRHAWNFLHTMEPGDSFELHKDQLVAARAAVSVLRNKGNRFNEAKPDWIFQFRRTGMDTYRCWRVR